MSTDKNDIKIRKNWGGVKPETRVEKVKKQYNRAESKRAVQDALAELEDDDEGSSF